MTGVNDSAESTILPTPRTTGDALGASVLRVDLSCSDTSPREARDHLVRWLGGRAGPEPTESVTVVASELVDETVIHAGSDPVLRASWPTTGCTSRCMTRTPPPLSGPLPDTSDRGFGLRIVVHLSAGWGWFRTSTGKVVWADIAV